ncbi:FBD domain [Arabidopsis suecica]|uniref:FBD domain n=1 Tax=Arabidopsis suecica TaxID=45249 RepID=A0A8T1YNB3_ARASU|nr:FBD domain [Arabidopsis suecica]
MDMISELTDDLILKIMSSLPFKQVIATSVLSKRWRSLWKLVPKLNAGENECIIGADFYSSLAFIYCGLRELRIEMLYTSIKLPICVYACGTLKTLILCKLHLVDVPPSVCLSSLKTLCLLSVKFSCDESVQRLLSICPVLEDLVVRRSTYTSVEIFTINVSTLRSLSIDYSRAVSQPARVHGFVINVPSLRYLNIRDHFSNLLMFANMPELVKANVEVVCNQSESLIGSLTAVRHLSLCSKISNIPYYQDTFGFFLEHLELCTCCAEWWNLLTRILKDAPRLRVLKLKSIHCAHYNDPMDRWNQPSSVPECLLSHLEILEWRQYKGTKPEKQVAKYILAKAVNLKMATFSSKSTEKHHMFNKLKSVSICSKACQLVFN